MEEVLLLVMSKSLKIGRVSLPRRKCCCLTINLLFVRTKIFWGFKAKAGFAKC